MENKIKELRYAIVQSVPVMLGYLFLGFAFGLMLNDAGYEIGRASCRERV